MKEILLYIKFCQFYQNLNIWNPNRLALLLLLSYRHHHWSRICIPYASFTALAIWINSRWICLSEQFNSLRIAAMGSAIMNKSWWYFAHYSISLDWSHRVCVATVTRVAMVPKVTAPLHLEIEHFRRHPFVLRRFGCRVRHTTKQIVELLEPYGRVPIVSINRFCAVLKRRSRSYLIKM